MKSHCASCRETPESRKLLLALVCAGGLLGYAMLLSGTAFAVDSARLDRTTAVTWLTGGSILAGGMYLAGMFAMTRRSIVPGLPLSLIIVVALAARLIVIVGPALDESGSQDYHRYLWDGALVANGINPYRYTPAQVLAGQAVGSPAAEHRVELLADRGDGTLRAINHPHLTTIYPPLAQLGFALGYWIEPFGTTGWRIVLLVAEAITVAILLRLLKTLALPAVHIAWFLWNPLLLRETYASLHMDMLVLPLLAGALLAGVRHRHTLGALLCVAGSAVKVWPIVLAPLLMRPLISRPSRWRNAVFALALCAGLFGLLWAPMLLLMRGENSGFVAYTGTWQNNDGFFRAGVWFTEHVLSIMDQEPWASQRIMRWVTASLICVIVLWQCRSLAKDGRDLARRCLFIVSAIFLLSPTQFPWYWLWCLPLLTVRPYPPLLIYTALLPLYHIQNQTSAVLWMQHVPVWGMLAFDGARLVLRRAARSPSLEVAHA